MLFRSEDDLAKHSISPGRPNVLHEGRLPQNVSIISTNVEVSEH